jgi:hypothetical protein
LVNQLCAPSRTFTLPSARITGGHGQGSVVELPGYVDDLDAAGRAEWQARAADSVEQAIADFGSEESSLRVELAHDSALVSVEWTGFPERVASCLTRRKTLELLDATPAFSGGGRALQEEYVEWRVVRSGSQIQLIELTTELPDYWALLAACKPERLLALVAEFAGEAEVAVGDVFGRADALDPCVSPEERELGFRGQMLGAGTSPYNDGCRAICCMRQQSNTLFSVAALAAAASTPRVVVDSLDGHIRAPRCSESIVFFRQGTARLARASDPLLVERLAQIAFEGRQVALRSPLGIYMQKVEPGRLLTPDGSSVPEAWFRFSRGGIGPDGRRRFQRLTFEVPAGEGFCISDLVDLATERPIEHGGEIADLLSVALFLRVSDEGSLAVPSEPVEIPDSLGDSEECSELHELYANFVKVGR